MAFGPVERTLYCGNLLPFTKSEYGPEDSQQGLGEYLLAREGVLVRENAWSHKNENR